MTKILTIQALNSHQIPIIEHIDLKRLDPILGGSVQKIPGVYKVTNVTLKRGIVG